MHGRHGIRGQVEVADVALLLGRPVGYVHETYPGAGRQPGQGPGGQPGQQQRGGWSAGEAYPRGRQLLPRPLRTRLCPFVLTRTAAGASGPCNVGASFSA